jgi:hypothetical protein
MKFTLEIELGNSAMLNADDVAEALVRVAARVRDAQFTDDDNTYCPILDRNGNKVGDWEAR